LDLGVVDLNKYTLLIENLQKHIVGKHNIRRKKEKKN
jgi:hypothetical protein